MAVKVGSARIDENGHAYGGRAGDQTGNEVSTQNWYLHKKGWRVYRAKDSVKAEKIAWCMQAACNNRHIGYDQYQRNSLYTEAAKYNYDVSKVTKDVETDCSALVRVCCAYAGILGIPSDFRTINMPSYLSKTGAFIELKDTKYTKSSDYLRRGDILVTATSGHTVVVLSNGSKAGREVIPVNYEFGSRELKKGMSGEDVEKLQSILISAGCSLPKYGIDGDFGTETENAVKKFQLNNGLSVTGVVNKNTFDRLNAYVKKVVITGLLVNVRSTFNTSGKILGVVKKGTELEFSGVISDAGWYKIVYKGNVGWVSGKYSKLK